MKYFLLLFISLLIFSSCKTEEEDQLTRLTYDQMTDLVISNALVLPDDVKYYGLDGTLLSEEEREAASEDLLYADWYINNELVLIKVQLNDSDAERKRRKKEPLFTSIDNLDCARLDAILEEIYDRDQQNRTDNLMDESIDQNNLEAIELILDKCGMPTSDTSSSKSLQGIWLVIQHAGADKREQYFPLLEKAAQRGDLDLQDIALMKDRMLLDKNEPQIYGSQVLINDGIYELYQLQDPERVDARRATVGLGPLSEYLAHWDIEFSVVQKPLN
ncbi:DUF6624 domain-containing protein [Nonlabens sp. YIK11]|uniref:DUF6624 domain-containing protein n=1 Tax=Nonlabens sp. YIK11 TaxID=1453349 RepID=UPI000AD95E84|nr:DUF6624 domain-containing protein [Nonlabens sp. YIK11]